MRRRGARIALIAFVLVATGGVPAAADVSGPQIVGFLNAQRAAHGIPAAIVEDAALSDGCAKHNAYGRINSVLEHSENPALTGYTPEGNRAAMTSVLYIGRPWTAGSNPFETAPIHLHQLLAPRIDRMGASENQGYGCATTLASLGRAAPAADVTYTYPRAGAGGWPPSQVAAEGPYTPGELVGIAKGATTGPYLYVMFDGPDLMPADRATAIAATLTGPEGAVGVATVDNHTAGLDGYLPNGMQVIPRTPLKANSTYVASVAANVSTQGGAGPMRLFTRTWSFSTGAGQTGTAGDGEAPAVTITTPKAKRKVNLFQTARKGKLRKRRRIELAGRAQDASGVASVYITVEKIAHSPGQSPKRCRWLDPKKGLRRRLCSTPIVIKAKLSSSGRWTYDVARAIRLSGGRYRVIAYGLDKSGVFGNSVPKARRRISFTLKR